MQVLFTYKLTYLCISSGKSKLASVLRSNRLNGHRTMVDSYSRHLHTSQMLTLPSNLALSSFLLNEWPCEDDDGPNRRSTALAATVLDSTNSALFVWIYDSLLMTNNLVEFLLFSLICLWTCINPFPFEQHFVFYLILNVWLFPICLRGLIWNYNFSNRSKCNGIQSVIVSAVGYLLVVALCYLIQMNTN